MDHHDEEPGNWPAETTLAYCTSLAERERGGALATTHAEDGTPYVTFVLFHLRDDGRVLFGTPVNPEPQHMRNMIATPEVSFLIDNRAIIGEDWTAFDRVVIEGLATWVKPDDARFAGYLGELQAKSMLAAHFVNDGRLWCIEPRRLILRRGMARAAELVDFEG